MRLFCYLLLSPHWHARFVHNRFPAMKSATLSYHKDFPTTPISGAAGARRIGWVTATSASGQWRKPYMIDHPFITQRKLWCLLEVHFNRVTLRFATPQELDLFLQVMSRNPLPSGYALVPYCPIGRPNNHWLSRLPARAKSLKFRKALCGYLQNSPKVAKFRSFYQDHPVQTQFENVHDSLLSARKAAKP